VSAKTAARLTRILAMLPWVIAHPGMTVGEVCDRFGYSRRQLIEDLDLVFVCGLPGYGPGDLMVAYVEDDRVVVDTADYFAGAPRLTPAESVALLAAGMAVMGSGQGSEALSSAVDKLSRSILPEPDALTVDVAVGEPEFAAILRRAAAEGEVVELTYTTLSRGDTSRRHIEPHAVFTSLGNWYCSAYCRTARAERLFRIDRIRQVVPTGGSFLVPETLSPPEVAYTPSEDDVTCVIDLDAPAGWVLEYYPVEVVGRSGESVRVRFSASDPMVAAGLLIRLGPDARLVEGDEIRSVLADLKSRMLARYGADAREQPSAD
jgi:proteasome accessory factor C